MVLIFCIRHCLKQYYLKRRILVTEKIMQLKSQEKTYELTFFKPGIRAERAMNSLLIFSLLFLSAIMWSKLVSLLRGFLLGSSSCVSFECSPWYNWQVFLEVIGTEVESSKDRMQDFGFCGEASCLRLVISKPVLISSKDEELLKRVVLSFVRYELGEWFSHESSPGSTEFSPSNGSSTEFMSHSVDKW